MSRFRGTLSVFTAAWHTNQPANQSSIPRSTSLLTWYSSYIQQWRFFVFVVFFSFLWVYMELIQTLCYHELRCGGVCSEKHTANKFDCGFRLMVNLWMSARRKVGNGRRLYGSKMFGFVVDVGGFLIWFDFTLFHSKNNFLVTKSKFGIDFFG